MPTWKEVTEANPAHSHNFARKWKMLEAQGKDIHGEARLVDAMVERNSTILDAGCGTGRVGGGMLGPGRRAPAAWTLRSSGHCWAMRPTRR